MKCENCNGTGKIPVYYTERRGVIVMKLIDCFICDGTGELKQEEQKQQEEEQKQSEEEK